MPHEADADALLDEDLRGVVSVVAHEADALHEAGVECRVVLWFFDTAGSMVAPAAAAFADFDMPSPAPAPAPGHSRANVSTCAGVPSTLISVPALSFNATNGAPSASIFAMTPDV